MTMLRWPRPTRPNAVPSNAFCTGCSACTARATCVRGDGETQVERIAKWGGSAVTFLGSLLLATTKTAGASPYVFLLLLVGNTAWTVAGLSMRDRAVVATSLLGAAFNLSAMCIRL
ncbi:MAG: hypothetical protein HZC24_10670 [Rhodocyclales bacterium]|nr:hypothetical protein [Rhodocyclales bacterium]